MARARGHEFLAPPPRALRVNGSLIAELDRDGHDTGAAWALLDGLRVAQVAREQNLDRILRNFAKP